MSRKDDSPNRPRRSDRLNRPNRSNKRNQSNRPNQSEKSKKNFSGKNLVIEIPGYLFEASLDLPRYHPHTIWWLAYVSRLLKGDLLDELIENPPWPLPKDRIIISHLIKDMIDYQWLIPNWITGIIEVSNKIKEIYKQSGEIGLARYYLRFETLRGQWWMDGLQGTPMDVRTAQSYDLDFSQMQRISPYKLKPENPPEELLEQINIDLSLLTSMLKIPKKEFEGLLPRALLSSPFHISGPKNLRFEMYGDSDKNGQKILPGDLAVLEPMLWSEAPEIFGKKPKRKRRVFQWHRSPVEKFILALEKFPDHLSLLSSGQYYKYLGQTLIDELKKKDKWIQWYRNGLNLIPIAGYSKQFFGALAEICEGNLELEQYGSKNKPDSILKKSKSESVTPSSSPYQTLSTTQSQTQPHSSSGAPEIILLCSSFLNAKNLYDDTGLTDALRFCSPSAKILIVYGHANDDLPEKQQKDIDTYCSKLFSLEPSLKNRVLMIPAKKRSHEKAILSSEGHWMIGSWNPCSSYPDSTMFEAGVMGKNYHFALEILGVIKEIIENPLANEIVKQLEDYYRAGIRITKDKEYNRENEDAIYNRIAAATVKFGNLLLNPSCKQKEYENGLNNIYLALIPFLKKGQVKLINEHLSRDVLVSQIHFTNQDIVLASDRVTKGALDRTIVQDILEPNIESKRYLRILWGREWEEDFEQGKNISPESCLQITEARRAIRDVMGSLGSQIKTSLNPMENHAKLALFDGCRGLITSENFLSYGGEKTQYESRELGIFIESPPIIRFIEGKTIYHRLALLEADRTASEMAYRPYEWIVNITDQYFALEDIQEDLDFDYSHLKYLKSALEMNHTQPDMSEISEFDRKLLKSRWDCYIARQESINKPLFQQLYKNGIKYYLLLPSKEQKWQPYSLSLNPKEYFKLYDTTDFSHTESQTKSQMKSQTDILQSLNLLKPPMNQITGDQTTSSSASSSPTSDSNVSSLLSSGQTSKIHPIVEEIMRDMVKIPAGSFMMGDHQIPKERPVHQVTLTQPFYMGKYMVTQELWKKVMGNLPRIDSYQSSPKFPIVMVDCYKIMEFINKLNSLSGSGDFDLPTDAQWEYACRAGSKGAYCFGNNKNLLDQYAWSKINANAKIHDVGLLKPNAWGLYDMHGLEFELIKDGYRKYTNHSVVDPIGPNDKENAVCRGGHWGRFPFPRVLNSHFFRCSVRYYPVPKTDISYRLSFRLIRKIKGNNPSERRRNIHK